jgi:hypothetical protein
MDKDLVKVQFPTREHKTKKKNSNNTNKVAMQNDKINRKEGNEMKIMLKNIRKPVEATLKVATAGTGVKKTIKDLIIIKDINKTNEI